MFNNNPAATHPNWDLIKFELSNIVTKSDVISIMLIGSYSRGDYWRNKKNLSDVEFYIIVNNKNQYLKNIKTVNCDTSIIEFSKLKYLRKNLINYESKKKGIIIYGRDIRCHMPSINIENIEIDIVDEIILFRYYEIAKSILSKNDFKFSFVKNLNYILTWCLIRDGVLNVGFEERYKILVSNNPKNKITNSLFAKHSNIIYENIQSRFGYCSIPEYSKDIENIYNNHFRDYFDILFKKRSLLSLMFQIFYILKSKRINFISKIFLIFQSPFKDYRSTLVFELYNGIISRDLVKIKKSISMCNSYYPFLNEK